MAPPAGGDSTAPPAAACPICGKPATARSRPFCSGRCADADLQRWLSGRYAIPVTEDEGDGAEAGLREDDVREADEGP